MYISLKKNTYSSFCLSIYYFCFYFISYTLFLTFILCDFCVSIKHSFLNVSPFLADKDCFYLNTFYSVLTLLNWFVFFILMCIYRTFLNFKHMTWPNIVQSWQQRLWDCISVFDGNFEHCLISLFFWRSSFEVTLLYFALDNYFFYSVSVF